MSSIADKFKKSKRGPAQMMLVLPTNLLIIAAFPVLTAALFGLAADRHFGAHAFDAALLLQAAIPVALRTARPGTPEFRAALRDALEGANELVLTHGIADMKATDHNGFDRRARVMVTIQNGAWKLLP